MTNDATFTSPSSSLPPSPSLPLQAVSCPSDEVNNDNDAADVVVHNQAPLSTQAENPSSSSSAAIMIVMLQMLLLVTQTILSGWMNLKTSGN